MSLNILDIFPNINKGFSNIGFFFGAGTSKEAGYPLSSDLTKQIFSRLHMDQKIILEEIFIKESLPYSFENGIPDIEEVVDIIYKYRSSLGVDTFNKMGVILRDNIVNELISINNPNISLHTKFLKCINKFTNNRPESVYIFTTNYDLLFEKAAMEAQIPIHNGFMGILYRYFDIEGLDLRYGRIENKRFVEYREPRIKLVKLHGSISWYKKDGQVYESLIDSSNKDIIYSLIIPRKQKVIEALEHPYDNLFRYSSQAIGRNCKYIMSCGYSFRDEHINDQLIIPKLKEGKIRFVALLKNHTEYIEQLKKYSTFNYITESKMHIDGKDINESCDYWKFSKIVELLCEKAGIKEI